MAVILHTRKHGENKLEVSVIGLGGMGMCFGYGDPKVKQVIFRQNRTAFDSAEVLDPFENGQLVGEAITHKQNEVGII